MSLRPDELRSRAATAVATTLGGDWVESIYPYERFGLTADTVQHKSFAVGVPRTEQRDPRRRSVNPAATTPTWCMSTLVLRWAWRLQADAQRASLDEAMAAEVTVLRAMHAIDCTDMTAPSFLDITRDVDPEAPEFALFTATWEVGHLYDVHRA